MRLVIPRPGADTVNGREHKGPHTLWMANTSRFHFFASFFLALRRSHRLAQEVVAARILLYPISSKYSLHILYKFTLSDPFLSSCDKSCV